jgi:hypothetical protein
MDKGAREHVQLTKSQKYPFAAKSSLLRNPVYARRVESSVLVFSLSSDRQSYVGLVFRFRFIDLIINK